LPAPFLTLMTGDKTTPTLPVFESGSATRLAFTTNGMTSGNVTCGLKLYGVASIPSTITVSNVAFTGTSLSFDVTATFSVTGLAEITVTISNGMTTEIHRGVGVLD
jgi:hypothetical protein